MGSSSLASAYLPEPGQRDQRTPHGTSQVSQMFSGSRMLGFHEIVQPFHAIQAAKAALAIAPAFDFGKRAVVRVPHTLPNLMRRASWRAARKSCVQTDAAQP